MIPIYWKNSTLLLGYIEKVGDTWFSYTLTVAHDEHSETNEAAHKYKKNAIAEVKREYQRMHGKLRVHEHRVTCNECEIPKMLLKKIDELLAEIERLNKIINSAGL